MDKVCWENRKSMSNRESYTFSRFPPTIWPLIQQAQDSSAPEVCRQAISQITSLYWKPIYAFYRSRGYAYQKAEDLTQNFIAYFLEKEKIAYADQKQGRFRSFLLICARNFMTDQIRKDMAQKRSSGQKSLHWEQIRAETGSAFEPADNQTPEDAYTDVWRRNVLDMAVQSVHQRCAAAGKERYYKVFSDYYLVNESDRPTWEKLAKRYQLPGWKEACHMAEWVKKQLARAIREEVGRYVKNSDELEAELRDLIGP
jgi:DNA-directed RNA polymerase specialized sigma24 family protein